MTILRDIFSDSSFLFEPRMYLIPIAYLIGSIPFGVLFTKRKGIDLQKVGSRNIGATNVLRSAGKGPALATLLGDSLKGAVAVLLAKVMGVGVLWEGIAGVSAIIGHLYPIFLSFKGGKGVATGLGVLVVYSPASALFAVIIWMVTAFLTKYASLASITAFLSLPLISVFIDASQIKISFVILITFLIIFKHKENIKNLVRGTERKIGEKV
jgi:glycerol-3-phosphate acyltransferase PlsY